MQNIKTRQIKNLIFKTLVILFAGLSVLPLLLILGYLFKKGISVINWQFLFNLPVPLGELGGGIANALVGSALLISLACLLAVPFGVIVGVYLAENKNTRLAYSVQLSVDVLQGIPSIVIGIVAYAWLVIPLKSFSGFSGSVALAIMMLPVVVRTTEETLKLIPYSLKEAALALGVPYSRTIIKVVIPAGISGIVTGILLGVARIAGETAPLLFTAFGNPFMSIDITKPLESLPHLIFKYAASPYEEWHALAWGISLILVLAVLGLNIIAKVVTSKWKVQF